MKVNEEQIKDFLGAFKILFSDQEIKDIILGEDKEFIKTVVDKIDKFLAQTFKEIKLKEQFSAVTMYYVLKTKKLKKLEKFPLDTEDVEILNNKTIREPHKKIFDKYLELLTRDNKEAGYYIGVFENLEGETVRTTVGVIR